MIDLLIRFAIGGIVVSLFSTLGDVLRPRSFAGLFGAAPSVALATLGVTISTHGKLYASKEAATMVLGAVAFLAYAALVSAVLRGKRLSALATTILAIPGWLALALGLNAVFGGRL